MTDLQIAVRLKADGSGLVGQLQSTKLTVDQVKASFGSAAAEAQQLGARTGSLQRAFLQVATGARAQKAALDASTVSARQNRAAYQQLGFQVQDVFAQMSVGINPLVILAQQGGQVAGAMSGMGGRIGAAATTLSGPFGAAAFGAVTVLGLLASSLFSGSGASDTLSGAQANLASFLDRTTGKIKEQVSALSLLGAARAAEATFASAGAAATGSREELVRRARANATGRFSLGGNLASDGGGRLVSGLSSQARDFFDRQLDLYGQKLITTTQLVKRLNDAAGRDPSLREAARTVEQLGIRTGGLEDATRQAALQLARVAVAAGGATQAQRDLVKANTEASGSNVALLEAQARLAAATTNVDRAQEQLTITRQKAREELEAGRITDAQYRTQYEAGERTLNAARAAAADASKAEAAGLREHNKALAEGRKEAREAAQFQRELDNDLAALTRQFDPATAAANDYAAALAKILRLKLLGKIDGDQAAVLEQGLQDARFEDETRLAEVARKKFVEGLSAGFQDAGGKPLIEFGNEAADVLADAGRAGGQAFRDEGVEAAQAIAQVFGGKIGRIIGPILGALSGAQTGNLNSVGGPLGGLLTLFASAGGGPVAPRIALPAGGTIANPAAQLSQSFLSSFNEGFADSLKPVRRGLDKVVETIGSALGGKGGSQDFARQIGAAFPYAAAYHAASSAVSSLLGNDQLKGGKTFGPFSPFLTALFAKPLKGGATITNVEDAPVTSGNSRSREQAAVGLASSVQSAIAQIAETLGGELGDFRVSIGLYKDRFRINPSGGVVGGVKGSGAIDFGKDGGQAALMAAIADAIADGGVKGLSEKVQAALRSSPDIDKALKEALKVDEIETLLGGLDAALGKGFRDFERQAAERSKVAAKYGFDLVKLEELTGKDRLKMFEDIVSSRTGALKSLLDDLNFGDLFEGSLTDQRQKLLVEIAKAEGDAKAGVTGAVDTVANLRRRLLEVSRDAFGTAGGELAADRSSSRSAAEEIIRLENERAKAAQDAAVGTKAALDENNKLTSETNDMLAEIKSSLRSIENRSSATGGGAAIGAPLISTLRQANL